MVKKLSRFDDLEFLKAQTFAKMTKRREKNAKVSALKVQLTPHCVVL